MSIFEAAIVCMLFYQLFAIRAALERTAQGRESTLAFFRDSRKETDKMRSETRRDRAEDRQFYQQSHEATLRFSRRKPAPRRGKCTADGGIAALTARTSRFATATGRTAKQRRLSGILYP